jgi:exosome complex component CSL4
MQVPGNKLGDEIEYASGEGTYSENEEVRAIYCGENNIDGEGRTIYVSPSFQIVKNIEVGDILYGIVNDVTEKSATATLFTDKNDKEKRLNLSTDFAMMRIDAVKSPGVYIKTLKDLLRRGDIIKLQIIKAEKDLLDFSIRNKGLGVIKANCSKCRKTLKLTKDNKLYCPNCDRYESRKIGSPYLEVIN